MTNIEEQINTIELIKGYMPNHPKVLTIQGRINAKREKTRWKEREEVNTSAYFAALEDIFKNIRQDFATKCQEALSLEYKIEKAKVILKKDKATIAYKNFLVFPEYDLIEYPYFQIQPTSIKQFTLKKGESERYLNQVEMNNTILTVYAKTFNPKR